MNGASSRGLAVQAALFLALAFWALPAIAQSTPVPPPPVRSTIDERGVDLNSGSPIIGASDVAIGPAGHHGLRFDRQWVQNGWRFAGMPTLSGNTSYPVVSFQGASVAFKPAVGGGYTPILQNGATLNAARTLFTGPDGTTIAFVASAYSYQSMDTSLGRPTIVVFPDGVVWTYHYNDSSYVYSSPPPTLPAQCQAPNPDPATAAECSALVIEWQNQQGVTHYQSRLASITSSTGYQIKLGYATDGLATTTTGDWMRLSSATAINNAVEYCSPTAACALTEAWPTATYTANTVTGPESRTTTYTYSPGQLGAVRPPGASADAVIYTYLNGKVSGVAVAGATAWNYAYGTDTVTGLRYSEVWQGTGPRRRLLFNADGSVARDTNEINRSTVFAYCGSSEANCPEGLTKTVTASEGNSVTYQYDDRGNITSTTASPKTGSGAIMTRASYPSCTAANLRICNKPETTTDALNHVTNYSYDVNHGGLLSVTHPADANGIRPQTRLTYANRQAYYYKNSTDPIAASGVNIAVPTMIASCRSSSSCTAGTDERRVTVDYGPQTAGVPNNLLPVISTLSRGDGAMAASTTTSYDKYGRSVTVDGPLSGAADLTRFHYNLAGQVTDVVSPDPDGTGAAKFPAVRAVYLPGGQIDYVQHGTVDVDDGTWATWVRYNIEDYAYDTYQRLIRVAAQDGGPTTTYQVTDTVYDTAGRVACTIQRMNQAALGSLPGIPTSCAPPAVTAPTEQDRISYNAYDSLGRIEQVTTGYGTSAAATETRTFTDNGQLQSVTDAEGNKTLYEYDGHDRRRATWFPSLTTDGATSSTDYEQIVYDANSNITDFRTRRGEWHYMVYDNLNRLVTKYVPERSGLSSTRTRDVYYAYDLFGNMTVAGFDSFTPSDKVVNSYNALGQLVTTTTTMDGVSRALGYQYDVAGNLMLLTHPDGNSINLVRYPGSGALNYTVLNGTSSLFQLPLDAQGRNAGIYRRNPIAGSWYAGTTTFAYDAASRLSAHSHDLAGTTYDSWNSFTYNAANQIASTTRTNDLYGWPGHTTIDRSYVSNGLNQYTSVASNTFSYDSSANLTHVIGLNPASHTVTSDFVYDPENRMVSSSAVNATTGGSYVTNMRYDPLGRLYEISDSSMGTRRFLYDGDALVAEYNTAGTLLRRYVHGESAGDDPLVWFEGSGVTNAERRYLYADERGSIVMVTDSAGNKLNVNSYDEYGMPASTNVGAFQFTGQVWLPELGMYYYKARMYSPTLGRFMQTDPIGYADGMNNYAYVKNDPLNFTDPRGLEANWHWDNGQLCTNKSVTVGGITTTGVQCFGGPGGGGGVGGGGNPIPPVSPGVVCGNPAAFGFTFEQIMNQCLGIPTPTPQPQDPNICPEPTDIQSFASTASEYAMALEGAAAISAVLAVATSPTGVGGGAFGLAAGVLEIGAKAATGLAMGAYLYDGLWNGNKESLGNAGVEGLALISSSLATHLVANGLRRGRMFGELSIPQAAQMRAVGGAFGSATNLGIKAGGRLAGGC